MADCENGDRIQRRLFAWQIVKTETEFKDEVLRLRLVVLVRRRKPAVCDERGLKAAYTQTHSGKARCLPDRGLIFNQRSCANRGAATEAASALRQVGPPSASPESDSNLEQEGREPLLTTTQ